MNPQLNQLQQIIDYQFKNTDLLDQALVHRSSLNEQKQFSQSNERFEFFGYRALVIEDGEILSVFLNAL